MARVPVYSNTRVTPAPLANVRVAAPQTALPQVGSALQSAGGDLGQIAAREQELQDADRLFRAEAALKEEYLAFETSLRDRRGQNAWGVTNDVREWFERNGSRFAEELETDNQRRLFEQQFSRLRLQAIDSADRYERQEKRVSLEESARASITQSINLAAASHDNPEAIDAAKQEMLARIGVQAGFNGWTPERRAAEETTHLTNLHKQVLEAMVDADPERAREYFTANKSEIAGADRDALGELVRVGGLRAKAQRETDALIARGESEADTLRRAREKFEGEERDEIVRRVEKRFAETRAADQQREREYADAAWNIFARTQRLDSLPTSLLEQLDGRTLFALRQAEAGNVVTDWEVYTDLREEAFTNPGTFIARDLRQERGNLHPTQFRELLNLQEELQEPAPDAVTLAQQLATAHNLLGFKTNTAGKEARGQFDSYVQQQVEAAQREKGKKLTYDERQAVIDRAMIEGEVIGGGFFGFTDPDRRLFQVAPEDLPKFEFDVSEIPAGDRAQIERALKTRNLPVSDATIIELYRAVNGL